MRTITPQHCRARNQGQIEYVNCISGFLSCKLIAHQVNRLLSEMSRYPPTSADRSSEQTESSGLVKLSILGLLKVPEGKENQYPSWPLVHNPLPFSSILAQSPHHQGLHSYTQISCQ